jgi:putative component of membrane protein insertase Oxa1/YidC/SpoIIIJ protein YidD
MKRIALAFIFFYQRFVSPYKGFSCAYRIHTGGPNCSAYGYRVMQRYGFRIGMGLINRRLKKCGQVYREHLQPSLQERTGRGLRYKQAGFCDAGCDVGVCDVGDAGSCACDVLGACGDLSCDPESWWDRKKTTPRSTSKQGKAQEPIEPPGPTVA